MDNTAGDSKKVNRIIIIIILSVLFLIGCGAIFFPDYENPRVLKFLILTQILFIISIAIFLLSKQLDFENKDKKIFYILVIFALMARLLMFIGPGDEFYLSDDVYRYIWDGKVNANGINPFVYAPPATQLEHLQDDVIYPNINHPSMPTIYPPMAQNIFLVAYLLGGDSTIAFKLISALFELLTIIALILLLKKFGVRKNNILLYLYSPLVIIEFYMSAHLDILAMPFFITALIAIKDKRPIVTGLMMALAILVKFLGIFFIPIIFFYLDKQKRWKFALTFTGVMILLYIPYIIDSDGQFLGNLFVYLKNWQFNGSIYNVLKYGLGFSFARYIVSAIFIIWLIVLLFRKLKIETKLFNTYAGYLVLTPVFFPWYYIWIYPFVLKNLSPAFIYLSGTVLLSYHVHIGYYATGEWTPLPWLGILYYTPFFLLLVWRPATKFNRNKIHE